MRCEFTYFWYVRRCPSNSALIRPALDKSPISNLHPASVVQFFLHYPSTVGAYFDMAHELLDRIAWLPIQLNIQRAVSCENDTPGSQRF